MATIGPFKLHSTAASAALTGTLTEGVNEADIVTGGKTLIITLTGATWVAAGATFDAQRQAIIDGIDSAQAEATGWDTVARPAIAVTDVVRTSDTVVTITLPAVATYDITADETLTVTAPASATSLASAIVAAPTVVIAQAGSFLMVLTPSTLASATDVTVDVAFEVDWGDGVFVSYGAGVTASQVPTANITVRAGAATSFTLLSDTVTLIDVQAGASITSIQDFGFGSPLGFFGNLTGFNFSGTNSVTSLDAAFSFFGKFNSTLQSFSMDCSAVTSMGSTFMGCSSLTTLNIETTSELSQLNATFSGCSSLGAFPAIDTTGVISASGAWDNCAGLTSFPALNLSQATNISSAWNGCSGLTSFPTLNLPSVQNASRAWQNCSSLAVFPVIDLPVATDISSAWRGCIALTQFPVIDIGAATNINFAWFGCTGLTSFLSSLNFSNVVTASSAWEECDGLDTFPAYNFPSCTDFSRMFRNCDNLRVVGAISSPVGTNFSSMFAGCSSLRCVNAINTSLSGGSGLMFSSCFVLEHPRPEEIADIVSPTGLNYSNAATGDCTAWTCLGIDAVSSFPTPGQFATTKHIEVSNIDIGASPDPLAILVFARGGGSIDFSTSMVGPDGAGGYAKSETVPEGLILYTITLEGDGTYTYFVQMPVAVDAELKWGVYETASSVCVNL